MDLVEISPNTNPPVCKIMDYGKFKYSAQKKAAEARKKQKIVEIKEIKLRPMIDDHDYDVKMRAMQRFFEEGDKVKITLRYRGREMAHQEIGTKLLDKVKSRRRRFRQGRAGRAFRRPPSGDGAGAALIRSTGIWNAERPAGQWRAVFLFGMSASRRLPGRCTFAGMIAAPAAPPDAAAGRCRRLSADGT